MADTGESQKEQPSTYFVQDRKSSEEMTRLEIQDKMGNSMMGGVLPELADPTQLRCVLDIGCATGYWLREVARTYPTLEKGVGIDISGKMVEYARTQAEAQQLSGRVEFRVMDALQRLDFPAASFDLVNQRAGFSWLRTSDWPKILSEYQRVTRSGGIIRMSEPDVWSGGNSPALTKLCDMTLETMYQAGHLFTASRDGMTRELVRLLRESGIQDVHSQLHSSVYQAGTETGQYFYEDMVRFFRVGLPFFERWTKVPSDYEEIYQQALQEMQQPVFRATQSLLTVWGIRP